MGMPVRPMVGVQVTKKMVGKEDDLEADLPLMDLGASGDARGAGGFCGVKGITRCMLGGG